MLDTRERPRFVWWVIAATMAAALAGAGAVVAAMHLRPVITSRDLPPPAAFVALERGSLRAGGRVAGSFSVQVLGAWKSPASEVLVVLGSDALLPPHVDRSFFWVFKRGMERGTSASSVVVDNEEIRSLAGRQ